jgi:acetyl-CoA carboxylase biotin carboxyl carrier protein
MKNAKVDSDLIRQLAELQAPVTAVSAMAVPMGMGGLADALPPVGQGGVTPDTPGAVCSPMVGNLYRSPRPGADPFIKVGDKVTTGQTLFIVEAMKVMNPIPAARAGTVKEILVQDNQPVEYNEVLAVIE